MTTDPIDLEQGSRRIRVLLVDDDPVALDTMEAVLAADCDVVVSSSPLKAIALARAEAAEERHFDVVCSDFRMREMDGTSLLRRMSLLPDPPGCVLVTGHAEMLTGRVREADHILGIVLKPCDPEELIRLVRRLGRVARMNRSVKKLGARAAAQRHT